MTASPRQVHIGPPSFPTEPGINLSRLQAFDTNLGINEVYSLAAQFITECPSDNPALPVKAFPVLKASPLADGKTTLSYDGDVSGKFAL